MPEKMKTGESSYDFTAQRLFIDSPLEEDAVYICNSTQTNYLLKVLRMKSGSTLYVFNGKDGEWSAEVESSKKTHCQLNIKKQARAQKPAQDLEYIFAPVKRSRLDYMVQKATELGVSSLHPVITHRTIVDRINLDRMQANIIEAAEQCGILNIPEIKQPVKFSKILDTWPSDKILIHCDERAEIASPIEALSAVGSQSVAVLIGPEGGFDQQERTKLADMPQSLSLSLGPRIMRADTAAIAALTLVNAVLGDWK